MDYFRFGSNKFDTGGGAISGKVCVFGEKSIPGMDGIGPRPFCYIKDLSSVEIDLGRLAFQLPGFGGHLHMAAVLIRLGKNCHRGDAQFAAGLNNTHCNFAAIGDENLVKHN